MVNNLENRSVSLSSQNSYSNIETAIIPKSFYLPSSTMLATSILKIRVSENATAHPYTLNILGSSSSESKSLPVSISSGVANLEIPALLKGENITGISNLMVTTLPRLSFQELINNAWVTPITGVFSIFVVSIIVLVRYKIITSSGLLMKTYKERIDDLYRTYQNKEECLQQLDEIRMELAEILNKGKIGYGKYRILNEKIVRYTEEINIR